MKNLLPRCEGEIARSAKSHSFTTTGQSANGNANSAKWNVNTAYFNGWNIYTTATKAGSTLFFIAEGHRTYNGKMNLNGKHGHVQTTIPSNTDKIRHSAHALLAASGYVLNPILLNHQTFTFAVRAVHD